jgi:hypothetical protein
MVVNQNESKSIAGHCRLTGIDPGRLCLYGGRNRAGGDHPVRQGPADGNDTGTAVSNSRLSKKHWFSPTTLQEWDGDPGQIPTKDKTYIWVNTFARWKIVDPVLFFKQSDT